MISILAQERLLGFALGVAATAVAVVENRRNVHKLMADSNSMFGDPPKLKKPVVEKRPQVEFAHLWNKAVDKAFGPVITSLSQRGW
ncbi:hypothetical protein AKJ16_DCAP01084 [Drosera capensis]